jgi:hypothetical protein
MPKTVISEGYAGRIEEAGAYVRDCYDQWKNALKARNELIVEAVDNGFAGHAAARAAKVKQPHIIRICSQSQPDVSIDAK